jgi:transcriptional regulator with XRE-family HTH domain
MPDQNAEVNFVNFYESFIGLCNKVGKTPSRVALEIGLSKPTVNRWKNGSTPTDATAMKLAEYFGVTVQELTGEADLGDMLYEVARDHGLVESPFKKEKSTVTEDDGLTESQRKLFKLAKELPEDKAELLFQLMQSMIGESKQ